jgi:hypothetical protein
MAAAAHNPAFAKKVGIPVSVAKDFNEADKGKKFGKGGTTSDKARINKQNTRHGKMDMPFASLNKYAGMAKGGDVAESKKMMKKEVEFFKKKGAPKSMIKHEEAEMEGGKKPNPFAKGNPFAKAKKFAKGGGIESKGKTKGRMC